MHTDALVLKTWPYSESTLIVSLLTREGGAARLMAKGARRLKGRTGAAYDLFAHVRIKFRPKSGGELGVLGSIELKHSWLYLRRDLKRLALASVGLEILGAIAATSSPEPFFFDEAQAFLNVLEEAEAPGTMTAVMLIRALHHAGYPPRLHCDLDRNPLPARLDYDFDEGIFVARSPSSESTGRKLAVSSSWVQRLRSSLVEPPELDGDLILGGKDGAAALRWLILVWEDHLRQKVHSVSFLERTVLKV